MKAFAAWLLLLIAVLVGLFWITAPAHAEEITPRQIDNWLIAYSVERSSPTYPYRQLVADVRRVVDCESDHLDVDVINGRRFGKAGEIGPAQFMPGPGSLFWTSEAAARGYSYWDPEANVAAMVELISRGYGPRNWSCW